MAAHRLTTLLAYLLLTATTFLNANAAEVNQTIDDLFTTSPDGKTKLTYSGGWGLGQECAECLVKPDIGQAHAGTWHDTTANATQQRTIEFDFTGTALYVFGIMANAIPATNETVTTLDFVMDGKPSGNFKHTPSSDPNAPQYEYNSLVYGAQGLANTTHKFILRAGGPGSDASLVLFDYLVFTQDTGNTPLASGSGKSIVGATNGATTPLAKPTSSNNPDLGAAKHSNIGAIVGGIIGGVCVIGLIVAAFIVMKRRRDREEWRVSRNPMILGPGTKTYEGYNDSSNLGTPSSHGHEAYGGYSGYGSAGVGAGGGYNYPGAAAASEMSLSPMRMRPGDQATYNGSLAGSMGGSVAPRSIAASAQSHGTTAGGNNVRNYGMAEIGMGPYSATSHSLHSPSQSTEISPDPRRMSSGGMTTMSRSTITSQTTNEELRNEVVELRRIVERMQSMRSAARASAMGDMDVTSPSSSSYLPYSLPSPRAQDGGTVRDDTSNITGPAQQLLQRQFVVHNQPPGLDPSSSGPTAATSQVVNSKIHEENIALQEQLRTLREEVENLRADGLPQYGSLFGDRARASNVPASSS